jgi:hypothetical protein
MVNGPLPSPADVYASIPGEMPAEHDAGGLWQAPHMRTKKEASQLKHGRLAGAGSTREDDTTRLVRGGARARIHPVKDSRARAD